MNWNHKDGWRSFGRDLMVMVSRHTESLSIHSDDGPNRWAVYAFIYPKHPHFAAFDSDSSSQEAASLGFHGGCSFLKRHTNTKGAVTSIQVGADYHHLYDDFTHFATQADAHEVFEDAESLFARLERMNQKEVTA